MKKQMSEYKEGDLVCCIFDLPDPSILAEILFEVYIIRPKKKMVFRVTKSCFLINAWYLQLEFSKILFPEESFIKFELLSQEEKNEYQLYHFIPN